MQDLPISYFPVAERQHCSEALQKLFAELEATLGFVPNVIRAFAWREPRFWKWWAHRNDLMAPSAGLSKAEREMVAVVVSAANDCLYCMTSHGYAVRVLLGDPVTAERILLDYRRAGLELLKITTATLAANDHTGALAADAPKDPVALPTAAGGEVLGQTTVLKIRNPADHRDIAASPHPARMGQRLYASCS